MCRLNPHLPHIIPHHPHAAFTALSAEDIRGLHTRAIGNPNSIIILGTGVSTEMLAKLFEDDTSVHKTSATAFRVG